MAKEEQKNTISCENRKRGIVAKELALEIKEAIEDCFVAQVAQEGARLTVCFPAGQTFSLCIEEQGV